MMYRHVLWMVGWIVLVAFSGTPLQARIEVDTVQKMTTAAPPRDVSMSADGQRVFILTADGKVDVLGNDGRALGQFAVPATVDGIESSPDGGILFLRDSAEKSIQVMTVSQIYSVKTADRPVLGNKNAPVTLAVFSDFQ